MILRGPAAGGSVRHSRCGQLVAQTALLTPRYSRNSTAESLLLLSPSGNGLRTGRKQAARCRSATPAVRPSRQELAWRASERRQSTKVGRKRSFSASEGVQAIASVP
eukprot:366441-Chlamydomonas_euryale.AAC.8